MTMTRDELIALLDVHAPLAPTTEYAIVIPEDVRDRSGASVGYFASSFTTASGPLGETTLSSPSCTLDERTAGDGRFCALVQDDVLRLRTASNNATYGYLDGGGRRTPFFAPRGEIALALEGRSDLRVFHLHGPGGVGKSAIARAAARAARANGHMTVVVDGRTIAPIPTASQRRWPLPLRRGRCL